MSATELGSQLTILIPIYGLTALVWGACMLTALAGYRAFKVNVDLGWAGAFFLLALARGMAAHAAYMTSQELSAAAAGQAMAMDLSLDYQIVFAVLEIVAAIAIFFLYRARGSYFRRRVDRTD